MLEHLKITILCENVVGNLAGIGEHGYAAFIETGHAAYLFDTGSGTGIIQNALTFRKDLRSIQKLFISHGHYDHTGGMAVVLDMKSPLDVHAHPAIFDEKFVIADPKGQRKESYIGMPHRRQFLEAKGAKFIFNNDFQEIADGIYLTGEIPRVMEYEKGDPRLHVKRGATFEPDNVPDDQALVLSTKEGVVVLLGCAHSGTINTLKHVAHMMGDKPFRAVIGGTHLGFLGEDMLNHSISALKGFHIGTIGVSHCTGLAVAGRLMNEFGDRYFYASVGSVFEIT